MYIYILHVRSFILIQVSYLYSGNKFQSWGIFALVCAAVEWKSWQVTKLQENKHKETADKREQDETIKCKFILSPSKRGKQ